MGLDMYLTKKTYVKNWDHTPKERRNTITIKQNNRIRTDIKPKRISVIIEDIGYWRKANAIHNWFVQTIQKGDDECQESYVGIKDLEELLDIVETVLLDHSLAGSLLPCQSGFFFGSYEYDDYYFSDLKLTRGIIKKALKEKDTEGEFYYQASW